MDVLRSRIGSWGVCLIDESPSCYGSRDRYRCFCCYWWRFLFLFLGLGGDLMVLLALLSRRWDLMFVGAVLLSFSTCYFSHPSCSPLLICVTSTTGISCSVFLWGLNIIILHDRLLLPLLSMSFFPCAVLSFIS